MSLDRGTSTRLSLKSLTRRFSVKSKDYSKVDDLYDTRVPLHNDDAFSHGLRFKAKFIGSLEISRPTCKVDIITAMRRIRYEYKVKGIRKVRSNIQVSTQGVKITKRKRKRSRKQYTEEQLFIMQHPIYRIFYVSHDSQDMKIFSYITRELPDSTFRCNVFKAYKKNMALHVVRSLGQAFDVCHRLNPRSKKPKKEDGEEGEGEEGEEGTKGEGEGQNDQNETTNGALEIGDILKDVSLNEGGSKQKEPTPQVDLIGLDFDPFSFNFETPSGGGEMPPNGAPLTAFDSSFAGQSAPTQFPPLMVSNNPSGFPDLPVGSTAAQTQLQLSGRPRPRPATTANQRNIIQENPFTDTLQTGGSQSPELSIGEAIDGPEKMISNPFMPQQLAVGGSSDGGGQGQAMWEMHKQQMAAQMTFMQAQLKQETAARIESQARVEHLLEQNKQLLTHVQKVMVELEKLQSLQMAKILGTQPPPNTTQNTTTPDPSPSTPSLPVIPETTSEVEPLVTTSTVISTPPSESPPPPPETPPTTDILSSELTGGFIVAATDSTSNTTTSTTTMTTDSEPFQTPFDLPVTTPLLQSNDLDTSPRTSTPVAPSPDPQLHDEEDISLSQLPDSTNLPTNDPFIPQ